MYPIHGVQQAIMRAIIHNNLKYTHVNTSTQVPRCYVVNGVDSFAIWVINDPSHKRTFLGPFCNKQDHRHPRNTPRLPLVELLYSDTGLLQSAGHEKCSYWLALPRRGWQALIGREQRHITLPKTGQPLEGRRSKVESKGSPAFAFKVANWARRTLKLLSPHRFSFIPRHPQRESYINRGCKYHECPLNSKIRSLSFLSHKWPTSQRLYG